MQWANVFARPLIVQWQFLLHVPVKPLLCLFDVDASLTFKINRTHSRKPFSSLDTNVRDSLFANSNPLDVLVISPLSHRRSNNEFIVLYDFQTWIIAKIKNEHYLRCIWAESPLSNLRSKVKSNEYSETHIKEERTENYEI